MAFCRCKRWNIWVELNKLNICTGVQCIYTYVGICNFQFKIKMKISFYYTLKKNECYNHKLKFQLTHVYVISDANMNISYIVCLRYCMSSFSIEVLHIGFRI